MNFNNLEEEIVSMTASAMFGVPGKEALRGGNYGCRKPRTIGIGWLLYGLVRACRPETVVEIGTGGSTACILWGLKHNEMGHLHTCDVFLSDDDDSVHYPVTHERDANGKTLNHNHAEVIRWIRKWGMEDICTIHHESSKDFVQKWDQPLDFMMVDGDHKRDFVENDMQLLNYIKPGGYACFHDFIACLYEVGDPVRNFVNTHDDWSMIVEPNCLSLAVLQRKFTLDAKMMFVAGVLSHPSNPNNYMTPIHLTDPRNGFMVKPWEGHYFPQSGADFHVHQEDGNRYAAWIMDYEKKTGRIFNGG